MVTHSGVFDEHKVLHELAHYLPSQSPLKDFVHHNTLHAFQHKKFHEGIQQAAAIFGYKTYLQLSEYRKLFADKKISESVLDKVISRQYTVGSRQLDAVSGESDFLNIWKQKLLYGKYNEAVQSRIGELRADWKLYCKVNLDKEVHPMLFRILGSYLDQGISLWHFPHSEKGLLASVREMQRNSFGGLFSSKRAKNLLMDENLSLEKLLEIIVGDAALFQHYLFDQQFAHPGWSGMAAVLETQPETLLDRRKISLHDVIALELLLEIDTLDNKFGEIWKPLASFLTEYPTFIFAPVEKTELHEVFELWQEAYEWSYYEQVLVGIQNAKKEESKSNDVSFQSMFCIDDRECSFRRHLEKTDAHCQTFATPGFFSAEFYFQPEHGKFHTKVCPAPLTPQYIIKEIENTTNPNQKVYYIKPKFGLLGGWLVSQTLGFWSAFRLLINIFFPSNSPAAVSSFKHTDQFAKLTIENENVADKVDGMQVGFTVAEMANRVEGTLKSIGLVKDFAPLIYAVGHGASSINNTHYAGYDCGACSGRPGSVNARVISFMANHTKVRELLRERGIDIPESTQFVGALHDTTCDEVQFFDEDKLNAEQKLLHEKNRKVFEQALNFNAKERSRRFVLMNTKQDAKKIHDIVKLRAVSLFEPRPELNHATNALCIVGRREMTSHLFLDRRAFMNSFDYRIDPDGKYLLNILKAAIPVCGGINLEYYFSRVDNYRLGAGTKLPHNVMGLIGVANGSDGDLRTGLPSQMIEVHDPIRLLTIVEHFPDVVLKTIQSNEATYEWCINEWVILVAVHPETKELYLFSDGKFEPYKTLPLQIESVHDTEALVESSEENFPVYLLN